MSQPEKNGGAHSNEVGLHPAPSGAPYDSIGKFEELPIDSLVRGHYQPRSPERESEGLAELAQSIMENGVIEPPVVRPLGSRFELVCGHRRWLAARKAGCPTIYCLVRNLSDKQALAISLIENIQRSALTPIEEARAYSRMSQELEFTHEQIAQQVGKSRSKITQFLSLLKLPISVQSRLETPIAPNEEGEEPQRISFSHALALCELKTENDQIALADEMIKLNLSVRELKQKIKLRLSGQPKPPSPGQPKRDPNIESLERIIGEQLAAQVELDHQEKTNTGVLRIKYCDLDTLQGIMDRLGIRSE